MAEFDKILRTLHLHVKEHWGLPLVLDMSAARKAWFEQFAELNEDCVQGLSLTDLLYVIHCYSLVVANHQHSCLASPPTLQDAATLLAKLKLVGSYSSPQSRTHWPTTEEWQKLELQVAWLVVFVFAQPREALLQQLTAKPMHPLDAALEASVREARTLDFRVAPELAIKSGVLPAAAAEAQPGQWWLSGNEALVSNFIVLSGRVVQKVCFDNHIAASLKVRVMGEDAADVVRPDQKARLQRWLVRRCEIQVNNEFYVQFRNFCFEASLPANTLIGAETRKSAKLSRRQVASELLDSECGFHALLRVHTLSNHDLIEMAKDDKHEYHTTLLLVMFGFIMHHVCKAPFIGEHYFGTQHLHEFPLAEPVKWGMNKRPCILQLQKRIVLADVSGVDDRNEKHWECVPCADIYEAVLYWLWIMRHKYKDELLSSTKITRLYDSIFA